MLISENNWCKYEYMLFVLFILERLKIDSKCLVNYLKCLSKCMRYWGCLNYYGDDILICGNVKNWRKDKEINSEN